MSKCLVLKSVNADRTSYGGFQYPESGHVECPDWSPEQTCINGLHGWLWGIGDYALKNMNHGSKWIVIEVDKEDIIELNGKVKCPRGKVVFCGTWVEAYLIVRENTPIDIAAAIEYSGHAAATGYSGHAAATGYSGHAAATGNQGHACCLGLNGTAMAGENGSIILTYLDNNRRRHVVGYVGDGIEPNTVYTVRDGKLVKA